MDLAVLRTAKAALDEELITSEDFQAVKGSFVKAQSIKAGLDAGFITEADFAAARQEFFRGMGMAGAFTGAPLPSAPSPNLTPRTVAATLPSPTVPSSSPAPTAPVVASASNAAKKVTPLSLNVEEGAAPSSAPSSARGVPSPAVPDSLVETPKDIPDHGGAQATAGKASMSGITVHANAVNIVGEMRIRKKYRWIVFKIGQTGKQVEVDKCGGPKSTFEEFAAFMPESECRYGGALRCFFSLVSGLSPDPQHAAKFLPQHLTAVYDYEYQNSEGTIYGKLVFVSWAPEVAPTKAKMQHASTKDFFRGFLDGISVELHATEANELDEPALRERVSNTVAKK